jgi:uncharacterized protein
MRVIFWLILLVLVVVALKKKSKIFSTTTHYEAGPEAATPDKVIETMLCCERCHVYFPASEAVLRGRKAYCCAAHADQV